MRAFAVPLVSTLDAWCDSTTLMEYPLNAPGNDSAICLIAACNATTCLPICGAITAGSFASNTSFVNFSRLPPVVPQTNGTIASTYIAIFESMASGTVKSTKINLLPSLFAYLFWISFNFATAFSFPSFSTLKKSSTTTSPNVNFFSAGMATANACGTSVKPSRLVTESAIACPILPVIPLTMTYVVPSFAPLAAIAIVLFVGVIFCALLAAKVPLILRRTLPPEHADLDW
mmetsp:Transcript_752/g.2385  ORF Transcript_752/g.2385 Transcript_752/m.2385 type:complete len:231 (+) Transcript_752:392-1084(+)